MDRYKTHTCITGRPRSQRSRRELYESHQASLAHIPHRNELQTGPLQIPSSLQSHSPYIHWQSTIRNYAQSKNTHTSLSLSGASTWPTATSTAWQIEDHPKVLQWCQVQCQAAQHSYWGQGTSAPERIKNTKPQRPPSIPGHRDQRKSDHSPGGWQSTKCEDVQEGVSKPTTAVFQPKVPLDRHEEDPSHFSCAGRPTVPVPLMAAQPTTPVASQTVAQHTPRTVPLATELNPTQMAEQNTAPPSGTLGKCKGSSTTTPTGTWTRTLTSHYCRELGDDIHPMYMMPKLDHGNNRELTRTLYLN